MSDTGMVSIILAVVGLGITIIGSIVGVGLAIIGVLGNNKFNKLSMEIDNKFDKLSTQIEGIEIRLGGELSRINSEINLLRERHTTKIDELNNTVNYSIKALEDVIRSNDASPARKEPNRDEDASTRGEPKSNIEQRVKRLENMVKSNEGDFPYDKYRRNIRS